MAQAFLKNRVHTQIVSEGLVLFFSITSSVPVRVIKDEQVGETIC